MTPRATLSLPNRAPAPVREGKHPQHDSVVYLIQEPTIPKYGGKVIDISPLSWWGRVSVLIERGQVASFRPGNAYEQIRARLATFNPDKDFLAVAGGDSLAVVLTGSVLAQYGHTYFYYLRFERTRLPDGTRDPSTGGYAPILVPLTPEGAKQ
jgi:hypothetical protein